MKIYKSEIKDGLQDVLLSNNTLAWCAVAEGYNPSTTHKSSTIDKLIAENQDQLDLYYLQSILVSTGWNKNDDVFDPQELWSARSTPEDKPFNFMHNEKDIIGHITGNKAVDFQGQELVAMDEIPDEFNILTTSVIYTEWSDAEQKDRMHKIIAEIEDGKWFVSMECLFPDFDYAVVDEAGNNNVIQRSEASAFLTKHLRSYGGSGTYDDYRVGRLLRNLSFSGKGLVSNPANPRSVILEDNIPFNASKAQILTISSFKESEMSDVEKQLSDLRSELAEAKTVNEKLREQVAAEKQAEFDIQVSKLNDTLAEKDAEIQQLADSTATAISEKNDQSQAVQDLTAKVTEQEKLLAEREDELSTMKQKEIAAQRQSKLESMGFNAEDAIATIEKFKDMDGDTFDNVIALMALKTSHKAVEAEAEALPESDEETDTAAVSEEALADVDEVEETAIAEVASDEDPVESLRATASEWLGSVLQSVPKE